MAINDTDKFLINDGTKTETVTFAQLKADIDGGIDAGDTPPAAPELGDLWVDMSQCPPTLNIWDDCDNPGNPSWKPIGGGDSYVGMVNNTAPVIGVVGGADPVVGEVVEVTVEATVLNGENPVITETQWFLDGVYESSSTTFTIPANKVGSEIQAKQKFEDDRSALVSEFSNEIVIESDYTPISFDVVITDDGTPEGNQVGKTLQSDVENLAGGDNPGILMRQWKTDDVNTSTGTDYIIQLSDIGKTISCEITCADQGGGNPVSVTGAYDKTPASALTVGKGEITPNVDVEAGNTLTGSATVTGASNPVETHVWELNGNEAQRGTNNTYIAAKGVVRYRKEVTDDYATAIGDWSDPVSVTEPITPPNATMFGLRFDQARDTYLSGVPGSGSGTHSYWLKDASTGWVWQHQHLTNEAFPSNIRFDGYCSDYYYVDGKDVPAEVFTTIYDGKVGPLDSTKVIETINAAPYDGFGTWGFYLSFNSTDGDLGNDGSGNGNDFTASNFDFATGTDQEFRGTIGSKLGEPIVDEENAFDGDTSTTCKTTPIDTTDEPVNILFTPRFPITVNSSLRFWTYDYEAFKSPQSGDDPVYEYQRFQVNDGPEVDYQGNSGDGQYRWVETGFTGILYTLNLTQAKVDGAGASACEFGAIEVDGNILTSTNARVATPDVVLDTPMNNYAVLVSGNNGNLDATADGTNLTYVGEPGTEYYYEADFQGAIHQGGQPFSSVNGVKYNFGQQPFAKYPDADGRLVQTWLQYARTTLGYLEDRIVYLERRRQEDEATIQQLRNDLGQAVSRLSSLEADEVNDDATDTVLVNAVADLLERVAALEAS